jgi:hypothetical protein
MPVVTPGTAFLFRGVAYLSVYVGSVYYGASQVAIYYGVEVSKWILITGALVAAPVLGRLYVSLRDLKHKRRAAALGARVVPRIRGAKMGNLDVVERAMNNSKTGYVGTSFLCLIYLIQSWSEEVTCCRRRYARAIDHPWTDVQSQHHVQRFDLHNVPRACQTHFGHRLPKLRERLGTSRFLPSLGL